jgi:hypothetical protein
MSAAPTPGGAAVVAALAPWQADPRWVAWHAKVIKRGQPPRKIPYGAGGKLAEADNPDTWLTFADAERLREVRAYTGLGIMLGHVGDLCSGQYLTGVDLDSCFDANGQLQPWAKAILDLIPSYAEISPSGASVKLWFTIAAARVRPFLQRIGVPDTQWGTKRTVGVSGTPPWSGHRALRRVSLLHRDRQPPTRPSRRTCRR